MTDTAVATSKDRPPIVILRERLEARRGELQAALTDIAPEQFIRALITSATINPELQACSWSSLWLACMRACRDQLLPDGREGAIVPFKSTATWIPMYQGLLKRFRQSGQFKWITAGIVREGERFDHYIDELGEHFLHVPGDNFSAPIVKIYAMATTKDGGVFINVMSIAEANKIRAMSRATRDDSPWRMWPEEMLKKTALRRLAKLLPAGRDFADEEPVENASPATPMEVTALRQTARPASAAESLEQFASAPAVNHQGPADLERGVQDAQASDTDDAGESAAQSATMSSAPAATAQFDAITIAYQAGHDAKAKGTRRTAVPGEYRAADRVAECDAWLAGYDGKPLPAAKGLL